MKKIQTKKILHIALRLDDGGEYNNKLLYLVNRLLTSLCGLPEWQVSQPQKQATV